MKVIIAGGRDYTPKRGDAVQVAYWLGRLEANEVVSGCAKGADRFGEDIAEAIGLPVKRFPADWEEHGKAAGPLRNRDMADYAEALIALPGGRGTANMVKEAYDREMPVLKVGWGR